MPIGCWRRNLNRAKRPARSARHNGVSSSVCSRRSRRALVVGFTVAKCRKPNSGAQRTDAPYHACLVQVQSASSFGEFSPRSSLAGRGEPRRGTHLFSSLPTRGGRKAGA